MKGSVGYVEAQPAGQSVREGEDGGCGGCCYSCYCCCCCYSYSCCCCFWPRQLSPLVFPRGKRRTRRNVSELWSIKIRQTVNFRVVEKRRWIDGFLRLWNCGRKCRKEERRRKIKKEIATREKKEKACQMCPTDLFLILEPQNPPSD